MKAIFIIFLGLLFNLVAPAPAMAQDSTRKRTHIGAEVDILPFATGGWFIGGWLGEGKWRIRTLLTEVHKPDFTTTSGFTNHKITSIALLVDRFAKPEWKGWWAGGGIVYWASTIQTDLKQESSNFQNYLLNGSLGYNIKLGRHIYLSPWAGLSVRIGGDKDVPVDQKKYTLPLLNPEASIKFGAWF